MDGSSFDQLARLAAAEPSRRGVLRSAFASALAALGAASLLGAQGTNAKKRKKCRTCGPCQRCRKGTCKPRTTGTLCAGGYCQGGRCIPSFCAGKDHCVEESFCNVSGASCNCFVAAGSGVPFCGQNGYGSSCDDCEPEDTCVRCGDSVFCQEPCANPA